MRNSLSERYGAAFGVMKTKNHLYLLGLGALAAVLAMASFHSIVAIVLSVAVIPVTLCLMAGLCSAYLKAIRGKDISITDLFAAFEDFDSFKRVAGGLLWQALWLFIWSYLPFIALMFSSGFVFTFLSVMFRRPAAFMILWLLFCGVLCIAMTVMLIYKSLEYCFAPYILMTRPEVKPTAAIKESSRMTKGIRGKMFLAAFLPTAAFYIAIIVLSVLSLIPVLGLIFAFLMFLLTAVFFIEFPIFGGLVFAGFYDEAARAAAPPTDMPAPDISEQSVEASAPPQVGGIC